ncbi:MAG TPA: FKBP-type peptidyl-prolyl cis-trans isomerase, partial [Kofleriaceae bacterium]|nr:FKBP-type peptidyl-prolyl cis-trans isomerase [Kofleriaceae bacterium]
VACQRAKESSNQTAGSSDHKTVDVSKNDQGSGDKAANPGRPSVEQIAPPLDIKNPPADATKTASGLIYKKLVVNEAGAAPKRNDTVMINYTGWRQSTGETFFSNRSRGQPMPLNLATTAPGFTEAMQLIKKGEKAMLWVPPTIGYKGTPQGATPETLVYEVEVVDIQAAPEIPADLKAPAANAQTLPSGTKYVVVRPGTGKDKARSFDTVTYNYTAWDSDGRQFDSTEIRKRPMTHAPFRQSAVLEEVLTSMTAGQRIRFWVDADKMATGGRPLPGMPKGLLTYEVELLQIAKAATPPPPVPPDVAKPSADAKKTEKGTFYKVLKAGKGGAKPKPTDSVRVHYTGWTTDGRMFDSSVIRNEPAEFSLGGVIAGWTDGIPVMSVGDKVRFWIPEELAYKGAPGRPQGMLVFDVELLEIKAPGAADPHGHGDAHGEPAGIPAPPDVAAPPKDAKKSPKGVSYKVIAAGKGGPKPTADDTVKVHYTGWTTDGKMFDSSVQRGQPAEFPLRGVIAGWTDAIPVMSVGDKVRFWIPEELAYKGSPGRPQGMLVFDVELLEILPKQ